MKKYRASHYIIVGCILMLITITTLAIWKMHFTYTVSRDCIMVQNTEHHPANNRQYCASVKLFTCEGRIYFYPYGKNVKPQFYREFCVFDDGGIVSLCEMDMIFAEQNGYVYYGIFSEKDPALVEIASYHISTGENKSIETIGSFSWHDILYTDSSCYFPSNKSTAEYYEITNGEFTGILTQKETYPINSSEYGLDGHTLVRYSEDGSKTSIINLGGIGNPCIFPTAYGLIIYNEGSPNLIYLLTTEEELIDLFVFTGVAPESAINVHGDNLYLSVNRYKDINPFFLEKYKNDTLEGTYRISLVDFSVKKISEVRYDGLYIFDNTGIYATKNGSIFQLDYEGNILREIMS